MAWVWRFDATPAHQPDGTIRKAAARAFGPSGRLVRTAQAAAAAGDIHLTLAPTPETLTAWQEIAVQEEQQPGGPPADGAAAGLERACGRRPSPPTRQVLRSPFVPADIPGLLEADLGSEIDDLFARGDRRQEQVLGAAPGGGTLLAPQPLEGAGLGRLRQYGVERLVFPPDGLQPRDQRLTPGPPLRRRQQRPVPVTPAAVSDPELDPPARRRRLRPPSGRPGSWPASAWWPSRRPGSPGASSSSPRRSGTRRPACSTPSSAACGTTPPSLRRPSTSTSPPWRPSSATGTRLVRDIAGRPRRRSR